MLSDRSQRKRLHDITYMWNLKKHNTNSIRFMHAVECGQKTKKLEKISGQMGPTGEFSPEQSHLFWMLCYLLTPL